ncbi:MAG: GNAT family N-acetyltransferase [Treponema sp.]|nr:GNAT family N-acetyltransferase [Treponema sp.]
MKDDLQELLDSVSYITEFSGYTECKSAEETITNPDLPENGKKENVRLECIYNEFNEMVNFCEYYIDNDTIFLGCFHIKQNEQKKGLGKFILNMYEKKWKMEQKYNRVILNVDIKNWVAIRFWYNNGYNRIIKWVGDKEYSNITYAMLRLEKLL